MRVLLTAFEPFDGTGLNASLEGCRCFVERWGAEFDLRFAALPVEYGPDTEIVDRLLAEAPADVVLHTGQVEGAPGVRVERIAVNVRYAEGPGALRERRQCLIEPEGPAALFSTLPVEDVVAAIQAEGVPASVSNHAGIYLCNHVLYRSLRRAEAAGIPQRTGFLHVPRVPEQGDAGEPVLPPDAVARAIHATLSCLRAAGGDGR